MKINMAVRFENEGLNAAVSRHYEFDDSMTLKDLNIRLLCEADLAMLDYCENEDDEEEYLGDTKISIEEMW